MNSFLMMHNNANILISLLGYLYKYCHRSSSTDAKMVTSNHSDLISFMTVALCKMAFNCHFNVSISISNLHHNRNLKIIVKISILFLSSHCRLMIVLNSISYSILLHSCGHGLLKLLFKVFFCLITWKPCYYTVLLWLPSLNFSKWNLHDQYPKLLLFYLNLK